MAGVASLQRCCPLVARSARIPLPLTTLAAAAACGTQLSERRAGNQAYKAGDYCTALHHYERALAIVDFVAGTSEHDQQEIERNKVASLLNVAAVHLAQHEYGSALQVRPGWGDFAPARCGGMDLLLHLSTCCST